MHRVLKCHTLLQTLGNSDLCSSQRYSVNNITNKNYEIYSDTGKYQRDKDTEEYQVMMAGMINDKFKKGCFEQIHEEY